METATLAAERMARLQRVRRLARLLDSSIPIPGTKWTIGLDPILGLVPGGGDLVGLVISGYIIHQAATLGARKRTLGRMVVNVALDALVGTVPLLGDVFDAGFKANMRNVRLMEEEFAAPPER